MLRDLFSLFPAHAGVIPAASLMALEVMAFPRTCGGDPAPDYQPDDQTHFSPHMRG